jgi:monoamine oxidase
LTACSRIPKESILLNHPVCGIERRENHVIVSVGTVGEEPRCQFQASKILLALPPRLAAASILFTPELSHELTQAMLRTSTWMAGQAKFFALYDEAGWRGAGLSGQGFSEYGPLTEIHDASNRMDHPFGLTGFVGIPAAQRKDKQMVIQAILQQLQLLYGEEAGRPASVFYQDWAMEQFTATEYDQRAAHDHPLYQPPAGKTAIWDGLVVFWEPKPRTNWAATSKAPWPARNGLFRRGCVLRRVTVAIMAHSCQAAGQMSRTDRREGGGTGREVHSLNPQAVFPLQSVWR